MTERIRNNVFRFVAFVMLICMVRFLASLLFVLNPQLMSAEPATLNVGNQVEAHEFKLAASVTKIIDGDTFVADIALPYRLALHDERVRILGIDAPEKIERDKWEDSRRHLESLLTTHDMAKDQPGYQVEIVVREGHERDSFGRTLAAVYGEKGIAIGLTMLRDGKAVQYERE